MNQKTDHPPLTEGVYLIMVSLLTPRHGYAVMQNIEALTAGRITLGAGTLYGAINTLLEKNWISAVGHSAESRKKEYIITPQGMDILKHEIMRLGELVKIGLTELEGKNHAN
jgi:DNA-binding PadR family transcriptional regulator